MAFCNVDFNEKYSCDDVAEHHLGKLSLAKMKKYSDKLHQIEVVDDIQDTHGTIRLLSIRTAQALKSRGIGIGDVISLCGPNHRYTCLPIFASFYLGSSIFPFAENQSESEMLHSLTLAKPRIVICDPKQAPAIEKCAANNGFDLEIIVFDDGVKGKYASFDELIKETGTEEEFQPTEFDVNSTNALIMLSSGTTGLSKGVCLTHKLISLVIQTPTVNSDEDEMAKWLNLNFSTMFWISGTMTVTLSGVLGQTRLYTRQGFSPEVAVAAVKKYKPNCAILSEFVVANLVMYPKTKEVDFGSLKIILILGTTISYELKNAFQKIAYNAWLKNDFGMTECAGPLITTPVGAAKPNSVGRVLPWIQWKVVDVDTRLEVGPNQNGELLAKGPTIFKEYYKNPEITKETFTDDGWFKSGDLVYYDEDNYVFVIDRIKALLKYNALQIVPSELEVLIEKIDGVFKACVVGKPDKISGELPMAFVQKKPNSVVTIEMVENIIKENLSEYKQLRGGVVFLEKMPLTPSGKVNRKSIKLLAKNH